MNKLAYVTVVALALSAGFVAAQTTAFNFQGRLNDGTSPANGRYDLRFKLFLGLTGGSPVGLILDKPNTMLVNGVFSTPLDFGADAFSGGGDRFVEISVKRSGSPDAYTVLGSRHQILSVPFAFRSAFAENANNSANSLLAQNAINAQSATNATNAENAVNSQTAQTALLATNATNAATAQNALSLGGVAPAGYARLDAANTGSFQVSGNVAQAVGSRGWPKAMLRIGQAGNVEACYNGVTGANTGQCGYTVSTPLGFAGVYRIELGFPNTSLIVTATAYNQGFDGSPVASYRRFGNSAIEILTYFEGSADTSPIEFSIVIF